MIELPPPGQATVEGWLYVLDLGAEEAHAVFLNLAPHPTPAMRYARPLLRYRQNRPIDGLDHRCDGHRVRVSCVVGEPWRAKGGAYITRASGVCLESDEHILDALANLTTPKIPWMAPRRPPT